MTGHDWKESSIDITDEMEMAKKIFEAKDNAYRALVVSRIAIVISVVSLLISVVVLGN